MSTNVPNLKQIGGGHRKNGQKFVDLMWNDPWARHREFIHLAGYFLGIIRYGPMSMKFDGPFL